MHLLTCLRRVIADRHNILIGWPRRTTPWSYSSYVMRSKAQSNRIELIVTMIRSRDVTAALLETIGTTSPERRAIRDPFHNCLALFWFTGLSLPPRFVSAFAKSCKETDRGKKKILGEPGRRDFTPARMQNFSWIWDFYLGAVVNIRRPREEKRSAIWVSLPAPPLLLLHSCVITECSKEPGFQNPAMFKTWRRVEPAFT